MLEGCPVGRPLRWYLPDALYEVTTRTAQERFLLRPGPEERDLVLGVIGRGLALYAQVMLHAFVYLSNHMHMLLSARDPRQLAPFIGYVNGNVARRIGRLREWTGPFWAGRAKVIPVLDDESAEGRLRYILAHGVKEGLVERPEDWPGASSTPALLGETLRGRWVTRARTRRTDALAAAPGEDGTYEIPITPLPAWARMSPAQRIERARALCASIVTEYQSRRDVPALGVANVLATEPTERPAEPAHRVAPCCHASTPELRAAYRRAYAAFTEAYRAAATALEGDVVPYRGGFPPGSFGGGRQLVQSTTCVAPWLEPRFSSGAALPPDVLPIEQHVTDASLRMTRGARSTAPPRPRRSGTRKRSPRASGAGADGARSPPRRRRRHRARDHDPV
ncbi:MAG: hypothetical protein F9K40_03630 [Kofleriaceae bacterium]|nr:MAG: hypothetical protein F9K40_03630 [Kofleriaceae bacterium]